MRLKFNIDYPIAFAFLILLFSLMVGIAALPAATAVQYGSPQPVQQKTTSHAGSSCTVSQKMDPQPKKNVLYLTFDDGPGPYTDELLNILQDNHVCATFFVTSMEPRYRYCIAREAHEGNAVGIHTYSHDYSKIYSSDRAYWHDFDKMQQILIQEIGCQSRLMRFPGGSSNEVSAHYSKGIMSRLTKEASRRRLTYVDWNIECGDAEGIKNSGTIYRNLLHGVESMEGEPTIILCHDISPYTVDAMKSFLPWAKQHGYTFAVLKPGGYTTHHKVHN